jgi:proteasome lid subunit RPN8/RPN11
VIACAARALDAIRAHARRALPHECCGLLLGRDDSIDEAVPLENRAAEPTRRYEIDPRDYLAAIKRCRGTRRAVVGAYHSHPRSTAEPSESDRAGAFSSFLYLIAGPVAGDSSLPVQAYRFENGNFRAVALVPVAEGD